MTHDANDRLRAARSLVGDWQANGNSRELGDPTAAVWHLAARQLLAVLDGRDPRDVNPPADPICNERGVPESECPAFCLHRGDQCL